MDKNQELGKEIVPQGEVLPATEPVGPPKLWKSPKVRIGLGGLGLGGLTIFCTNNFFQVRGFMSLLTSRIDLGVIALCAIAFIWIWARNVRKPKTLLPLIGSVIVIVLAFGLDRIIPPPPKANSSPQQSASMQSPNSSQTNSQQQSNRVNSQTGTTNTGHAKRTGLSSTAKPTQHSSTQAAMTPATQPTYQLKCDNGSPCAQGQGSTATAYNSFGRPNLVLTEDQERDIKSAVTPYPGLAIEIYIMNPTSDSANYALKLRNTLSGGGASVSPINTAMQTGVYSGVSIIRGGNRVKEADDIAKAIGTAKVLSDWPYPQPPDTLVIFVVPY
jgi:hypothetical protein